MITERFEIAVPDTPKSVNHGGGGVRGHWTTAVREKQRWQDTFSFELLAWGIPKDMLHCKVGATLFFKKRMRRDTENYRHPVIKPLADAFVGPPGRVVHESRRIVRLQPGDVLVRVVLSPPFVERHPHHDGRMVAPRVDHRVQLTLEFHLALGSLVVAARHVLPHEHA